MANPATPPNNEVKLKVNMDFGESATQLGRLAATAHGLKVTVERLDAHLTELERRAEQLPKKIAAAASKR